MIWGNNRDLPALRTKSLKTETKYYYSHGPGTSLESCKPGYALQFHTCFVLSYVLGGWSYEVSVQIILTHQRKGNNYGLIEPAIKSQLIQSVY